MRPAVPISAAIIAALIPVLAAQADWKLLRPTFSPPARSGQAMAYDSDRNVVVMFGGIANRTTFSSTWELVDQKIWTRPATSGPSGRSLHRMAYHAKRRRVVLFGGSDQRNFLDETWLWDGGKWQKQPKGNNPPARYLHAMVYDSDRACIVMFGGGNHQTNTLFNDTWEWDGGWRKVQPSQSPPARSAHAMAYDSVRKRIVLFGGGSASDDTWEYDKSAQTWIKRNPSQSPPRRVGHAMAYSFACGHVVMFGGHDPLNTLLLPFTWTWDGTNWTKHAPQNNPPGRFDHSMVYDGIRGDVVLYGGKEVLTSQPLKDTWKYEYPSFPPVWAKFGTGCFGSNKKIPVLDTVGTGPWVGEEFRLRLDDLPGGTFDPVGILGINQRKPPFDLSLIGMTGCKLYVSLDAQFLFKRSTTNNSMALSTLQMPANCALVGKSFFTQGFSLDLNRGSPVKVVDSNAGEATIGAR